MKNTHQKFLAFLMTAALLLALSIPALAKEETTPPTCFISLTENALIISMDGKSYSYDVNSGGFQAEFYRYEPTNTICIRFTDASGKTRAIAMGEELQLALSGSFDSVTLNRSLGGTRFFLKSDADIKTFTVNSSGSVHIFGDAEKVTVYGAAQMFLQGEANVQKISLLNSKSSLNAAKGTQVNNITRVPGASVSGGGSIGRMNSTVTETDGGSSFSDDSSSSDRSNSSSSSDNGSSSVLEPSSPTPAPVKTVTIGRQQGTLITIRDGTVTFDVTTENIADGEELTINWGANGKPNCITENCTKVRSGKATVTIVKTPSSDFLDFSFTVTVDGVTSNKTQLYINKPSNKSFTIGELEGRLTAGTPGSVTFYVTSTTNIADGSELSAYFNTNVPKGVEAPSTYIKDGRGAITMTGDTSTVAGNYSFSLQIMDLIDRAPVDGPSGAVLIIIDPPPSDKTVTIGTQQGSISAAGIAGSAAFKVTTTNIADDVQPTINWGAKGKPNGITENCTTVKSGEATVTIVSDANTKVGQYPFTVTADGVKSSEATLVISE